MNDVSAAKSKKDSMDLSSEWVDCFDKYQVNRTKILIPYNTSAHTAYLARCVRGASKNEDMMALVMNQPTQLRINALSTLVGQKIECLLQIYAWGPVHWPSPEQREVCLIMQRPKGAKVAFSQHKISRTFEEKEIVNRLIAPMARTLKLCETRKVLLGNIHPGNMYAPDSSSSPIMLGDCFCGPPDSLTPGVYLPIQRAMADPHGRGPATMADQLYSLGVSILEIATGGLAVSGLSESEIIEDKIMRGTYATIVGAAQLPIGLIEPIRGLLIDDESQRWSLDELNQWLSGRRLTPKIPTPAKRAPRELRIGPISCWNVQTAAYAAIKYPDALQQVIQEETLETWLRRSLMMDQFADQVLQEIASISTLPRMVSSKDTTASHLGILMCATFPIKYKKVSILPLGFQTRLAQLLIQGKSTDELIALYYHKSLTLWSEGQTGSTNLTTAITSLTDELRSYLSSNTMGLGIERVAYSGNPGLPCLSDTLKFYSCMSARDILEGIDMVSLQVDRPIEPFDRHIGAFLGARAKYIEDGVLSMTESSDPSSRYIAMMQVYGAIQSNEGPQLTPNLAGWFGDLISEIIGRYKNRRLRADFEKTALELAQVGELTSIANLLGNTMVLETDLFEFEQAVSRFGRLNRSITRLKSEIASDEETTKETSRMVAAFVSCALSIMGAAYGIFLVFTT